jgi:D-Tyr-tRNAtyr deacylase
MLRVARARLAHAPCRSARKLLNARLFANKDTGRAWDRSVMDEGGELLCVSQVRADACQRSVCQVAVLTCAGLPPHPFSSPCFAE